MAIPASHICNMMNRVLDNYAPKHIYCKRLTRFEALTTVEYIQNKCLYFNYIKITWVLRFLTTIATLSDVTSFTHVSACAVSVLVGVPAHLLAVHLRCIRGLGAHGDHACLYAGVGVNLNDGRVRAP